MPLRRNAGEVLADPASPLGWTLVFEQGLLPGWLRGLVEFGIYREGELPMERPPVAGLFGGYFYINLSHCRVVAIRMGMTVEAFDAALLGNAAGAPAYQPHPDDPCQECSAKVAQTIGEILAASRFPQIDADLERSSRGGAAVRTWPRCPRPTWSRTPGRSCPSWTTRSPGTTTRRSAPRSGPRCSPRPVPGPASPRPCST